MSSQRTHNRNRRRNLRMEEASESADFEDVAQQVMVRLLPEICDNPLRKPYSMKKIIVFFIF